MSAKVGTAETAVRIYEDLGEIPAEVSAFASERADDQLWHAPQWFELLGRHARGAGESPRVYVLQAGDGEVQAVLYGMAQSAGAWHRGRRLRSMTNFYTMSYAPLVRASTSDAAAASAVIGKLVHAVAVERPSWDVIELQCLQESALTAALLHALRAERLLVDLYFQAENWFQPTAGVSAQQYFKSLPSQVRHTVTRKLKRAQREHRLRIEICSSLDGLEQGIASYQAIYARSWKEPEIHPEFIPQLLRRTAQSGGLRLGVLYLNDQPAAVQIWFVWGSRATIYKLAYDQQYAQLSVGSILTKAMFDHVIDRDCVREIDYGRGSEPYKRDWMTRRRNIVGLIAFNPRSPHGLAAAGRHFLGRWTRRLRSGVELTDEPRAVGWKSGKASARGTT